MANVSGERSQHFPAIERKHGQPAKYFLDQLKTLGDAKYPEQIAFLKENHGLSQTHANALVMYSRGSKSSKRFEKPNDYFKTLDPKSLKTVKAIFKTIQTKYPNLDLVTAWNQPMLKNDQGYIFGLGVQKNHILLNPFSKDVLEKNRNKLKSLSVNKHTIKVPFDWVVDNKLLHALVRDRIKELKSKGE